MARIRTIKPEFFTSEDITALTPLARLLFVALWCEADREGRLEWKPKTFKMRYLPADDCDIHSLCQELVDQGVVVLYGRGLAFIPTFKEHQQINNREQESRLPKPDDVDSGTNPPRVPDASLTRERGDMHDAEGKGKERKGRERSTSDEVLVVDDADDGPGACPQQAIIAEYHRQLPELPPVIEWSAANAKALRQRWRSSPERSSLEWWRDWFAYVKESDFLMGRRTSFQASLGWLVKAENFAKVINGQYENRGLDRGAA